MAAMQRTLGLCGRRGAPVACCAPPRSTAALRPLPRAPTARRAAPQLARRAPRQPLAAAAAAGSAAAGPSDEERGIIARPLSTTGGQFSRVDPTPQRMAEAARVLDATGLGIKADDKTLKALCTYDLNALAANARELSKLYGFDNARTVLCKQPEMLRFKADRHRKVLDAIATGLALPGAKPDRAAAVTALKAQPQILNYYPETVRDSLAALKAMVGGALPPERFRRLVLASPAILMESHSSGYTLRKATAAAKLLGVDIARYWALCSNIGRLINYTPQQLEERLEGLCSLYGCTKETAAGAALQYPSLLTTSTERIKQRKELLASVISASANAKWRAWVVQTPVDANALMTRVKTSDALVDRLRFYIATGRDATCRAVPSTLFRATQAAWSEQHGGAYEAWVKAGRPWQAGTGAGAPAGGGRGAGGRAGGRSGGRGGRAAGRAA